MIVAGIDGYKHGWIGIVLRDGRFDAAGVWGSLAEIAHRVADAAVIAVDIPIGLPQRGRRRADEIARAFIGPRRSSVFNAPPRAVLQAATYEDACSRSKELSNFMISKQSWALRHRIAEAEEVAQRDDRINEVHPEVTFCAMAGRPLQHAKRTWNGQMQRRALLGSEGIELPNDLGPAARVPVDDVLDAAACAWTAQRIAKGTASHLPTNAAGHEARIWY